jgi:hypothetical protein
MHLIEWIDLAWGSCPLLCICVSIVETPGSNAQKFRRCSGSYQVWQLCCSFLLISDFEDDFLSGWLLSQSF